MTGPESETERAREALEALAQDMGQMLYERLRREGLSAQTAASVSSDVSRDIRARAALGATAGETRLRYELLGMVAEWRAIAIANDEGSNVHESCATELEREVNRLIPAVPVAPSEEPEK